MAITTVNNINYVDFAKVNSIQMKQGDKTPIAIKLQQVNTSIRRDVELSEQETKATVYLSDMKTQKVIYRENFEVKLGTVTLIINSVLPVGLYNLEIDYNGKKYPSDNSFSIVINHSATVAPEEIKSLDTIDNIKDEIIQEIDIELQNRVDVTLESKFNEYIDKNAGEITVQGYSSPLKNLTGVFIGDSITEENARATSNYHKFIAERTGLKVINRGVSGTGYQDRINEILNITSQPDFFCVFLGTNDYGLVGGKTRPLGDALEHKAGTVAGSIYYLLYQISNSYPTTPIVVMTPLPRIESNPKNETLNNQGYSLGQLSQVIKDISKQFSIPVLDLYNESNMRVWDSNVNKTFFAWKEGAEDGLHPNDKGHLYISNIIQKFLEEKAISTNKFTIAPFNDAIVDLGNGVFSKYIRPTGMIWKKDTSFVVNIKQEQIDLNKNKILRIDSNKAKIINPNGVLSNSPYWYTLPNYEEGSVNNQVSEVTNFTNSLELMDNYTSKGNEYMLTPIRVFYTDKNNTNVIASLTNNNGYSLKNEPNPPNENTIPEDLGEGKYAITITPTKMAWNIDQSFIINLKTTDIDLSNKTILSVENKGIKLNNPSGYSTNSPYWFSVSSYDTTSSFNRINEITPFINTLQEKSSNDTKKDYTLVPIKVIYREK